MTTRDLLNTAATLANQFLDGVNERPVHPNPDHDQLHATLGGPMPQEGIPASEVINTLARDAEPGIVASAGPRYFGFVVGAAYPVAVAADWLVTVWDQNAGGYVLGPSVAVIEDIAADWLLELFGLPQECGVGFTTGCQGANTTALAAARHAVLKAAGWDVERDGLCGAPKMNIIVGGDAHVTIYRACRLLGLGDRAITRMPFDDQGRMRADELEKTLNSQQGPTIICAQAGDVNTGAFDPVDQIADMAHAHGAWLHVDGAFGLWARANQQLAHLARGVEKADSWATDAHKQLNVPQDCGIVMVKDRQALRDTMRIQAAYIHVHTTGRRDAHEFAPESSRRARGVPVYATLKTLGKSGVSELVHRCHRLAKRMADRLACDEHVQILNEVVLNQVLLRFDRSSDPDQLMADVIHRIQNEGTCWLGGTQWSGSAAMRISISGWNTTEQDIDRAADAILNALRQARN